MKTVTLPDKGHTTVITDQSSRLSCLKVSAGRVRVTIPKSRHIQTPQRTPLSTDTSKTATDTLGFTPITRKNRTRGGSTSLSHGAREPLPRRSGRRCRPARPSHPSTRPTVSSGPLVVVSHCQGRRVVKEPWVPALSEPFPRR